MTDYVVADAIGRVIKHGQRFMYLGKWYTFDCVTHGATATSDALVIVNSQQGIPKTWGLTVTPERKGQ